MGLYLALVWLEVRVAVVILRLESCLHQTTTTTTTSIGSSQRTANNFQQGRYQRLELALSFGTSSTIRISIPISGTTPLSNSPPRAGSTSRFTCIKYSPHALYSRYLAHSSWKTTRSWRRLEKVSQCAGTWSTFLRRRMLVPNMRSSN